MRRRLAAGSEMLQPAASERYRVIVRYREPSYERRHGARPEPCEWACALEARTNAEAVEGALEQFRLLERVSSATWSRHIIDAVAMREGIDDVDDVGE